MIIGISDLQGTIVRGLRKFFCGSRGNVSPLFALLLVPLIGAMSLGTETSGWFLIRRAMQNTADSAVLAAAANGDTSQAQACTNPCTEAKSVATSYGFTTGVNNTTVTAINNATCPSPATGSNCYQVTITKTVPLYLSEVLGYAGTSGYGGRQLIQATAFARSPSGTEDCMLTLSSSGGFLLQGGKSFTANGCDLFSNWNAVCNGHNGGFNESIAFGTPNTTCGTTQQTAPTRQPDPYQNLLANNPPTGCTPISSPITGGTTLNPAGAACITITGNLTIPSGITTIMTASPGTVLVIKGGGNIVLNGTLTTPGVSSGLTIVFTGTSGGSAGFITGGTSGVLEFSAPASGPWSGVSLYQDPLLTTVTNPTYSGSGTTNPTFEITGLIHTPSANLSFAGAINHDVRTGGLGCIAFVANTMQANGNGSIFTNPTNQCAAAGLNGLPTVTGNRQALVQ